MEVAIFKWQLSTEVKDSEAYSVSKGENHPEIQEQMCALKVILFLF